MEQDKFNCIICKKEFPRRTKGMRQGRYKDNPRPYRSITCSTKCAIVYNRMPLSKRDILKAQGGIINMEEIIPEVILGEDLTLCIFDDRKKEFGFLVQTEEKCNESLPEEHALKYYHDTISHQFFNKRENLELFKKGLKIIDKALMEEFEINESENSQSTSKK